MYFLLPCLLEASKGEKTKLFKVLAPSGKVSEDIRGAAMGLIPNSRENRYVLHFFLEKAATPNSCCLSRLLALRATPTWRQTFGKKERERKMTIK